VKFGVGLPTCTTGMMYPVPFATPQDIVRVAIECEQLGYYEVAGNDHINTQRYVRETFADPPDFFEPLITYAYCAARTSTLHFVTGVIVLPMRHPVLLAKQVATLDQFSGGRIILGVGVGAYREELESAYPEMSSAPRAGLVREGIEALVVVGRPFPPGEIARLVLRETLTLAFAGLAVGAFAAFALTRFLPTGPIGWSGSGIFLYGVSRTDALTYACASALLASVAVAVSWIPARRAMRVDPVIALRHE